MNSRTCTVVGVITGFCVAVTVLGLVWLNQGRSEVLQTITNFFAGLPVFIGLTFRVTETVFAVLFVIYWAAVGGIIGWLVSRRRLMSRVTALVFILALAVSHWAARVKLEREIEAAVRALFKFGQGG